MTALALQLASRDPDPWMWIAGYVGQVALGIALVVKDQMDNTY
jgi:hypothetical protein